MSLEGPCSDMSMSLALSLTNEFGDVYITPQRSMLQPPSRSLQWL